MIANSPLGHTEQKLLLRTLYKTRNLEPAGLLLLAFAVIGAERIAHKRSVAGDGHLFGGGSEAAYDGHACELRTGCGREGAGCGGGGCAQSGGAEEERHVGLRRVCGSRIEVWWVVGGCGCFDGGCGGASRRGRATVICLKLAMRRGALRVPRHRIKSYYACHFNLCEGMLQIWIAN
jgi:hypothetical protein